VFKEDLELLSVSELRRLCSLCNKKEECFRCRLRIILLAEELGWG
jgi:hypothetical protein